MSDTEIRVRYYDKHLVEQEEELTTTRGLYRTFVGGYSHNEELKAVNENLRHCRLQAVGTECKPFFDRIAKIWQESGYTGEWVDQGKDWYEGLKDKDIIEIIFGCC